MASSDFLRKNKNQHSIKNAISKQMDSDIDVAIIETIKLLQEKYPALTFSHTKSLKLSHIITNLSSQFPKFKKSFSYVMKESFIKPDGGFLYAKNPGGKERLILVAEVKHQGTNDKRMSEGLQKQAKGNAIERLGKNLIGIRAIFKKEAIVPFICFGSGYDFQKGSTILDRVVTMNDFFPLNKIFIRKESLPFEPVSMFFRYEDWSAKEMTSKMVVIADQSILYYF